VYRKVNMAKQREPGFYWVRFKGKRKWQIAEWRRYWWYTTGGTYNWYDQSLGEIIETRIVRPV